MSKCPVDLWRGAHSDDFPDGPIINGEPVRGILYPAFATKYPKNGGKPKDPDVEFDENGLVKPGGGTSLFDKPNVLRGKSWRYFLLPEGTVTDPNLVYVGPKYNKGLGANHYQIEPAKPMFPDVLRGALDNLARAAVAKAFEDARA